MQICNRICDCIFCQSSHIAYFSAYNGIFKIAYAKIMLHMQKFTYIRIYAAYFRIYDRIFLAFFLSNVVLRLLNILVANDYHYLQLDVE